MKSKFNLKLLSIAIVVIFSFALSDNNAFSQCPPDEPFCEPWQETVMDIPVTVPGDSSLVVSYKFCYRICNGVRQVYLTSVSYPVSPNGNYGWATYDLHYFYNLCLENLSDVILFLGITGFQGESVVPCGAGLAPTVVELGHKACLAQYVTFDTQRGCSVAEIANCNIVEVLMPDCRTTYTYCWDTECCRYNPLTGRDEEYYVLRKTKLLPFIVGGPAPCPPCEVIVKHPGGATERITVYPEPVCE